MILKNESAGKLCAPCQKALLNWVDEIAVLDRHLVMVSELCQAADESQLAAHVVAELGVTLKRYRERRMIIDYFFMGKDVVALEAVNLDEEHPVVRGELCRLSERPRQRRFR